MQATCEFVSPESFRFTKRDMLIFDYQVLARFHYGYESQSND